MSNNHDFDKKLEYKCACCSVQVSCYQEDPDQLPTLCRECTRDRKMYMMTALFVTDPRDAPVRAAQAVKIADEMMKAFWAIPFGGTR